ncbi:hypothetical protein ACRRTK_015107 [Alexandromys fortis]
MFMLKNEEASDQYCQAELNRLSKVFMENISTFFVPGGHRLYLEMREKIEHDYWQVHRKGVKVRIREHGKGVKVRIREHGEEVRSREHGEEVRSREHGEEASEVFQRFLQSQATIENSILKADTALTAGEEVIAEERAQKEAAEKEQELLRQKQEEQQQLLEAQEKSHKENHEQLRIKLIHERDQLIEDHKIILENQLQNAVAMFTVTVRENIEFSAALRLPMTMTREEKRRRVNEVLELLHLDKESNVKPRPKELRKRTSIAMELVTQHPILFFDDLTTGLEWSTTTDVISVLRRMSLRGRTIIFSINQPPYSIFRLFDSLTLLASGKVMFHGPAQEALEYFKSAGYEYDSHNNPADFFLDIINGGFSALLDTEEDGHDGI